MDMCMLVLQTVSAALQCSLTGPSEAKSVYMTKPHPPMPDNSAQVQYSQAAPGGGLSSPLVLTLLSQCQESSRAWRRAQTADHSNGCSVALPQYHGSCIILEPATAQDSQMKTEP